MLLEYINYLWIMFLNYGNGCFKYCPKFREEKKKIAPRFYSSSVDCLRLPAAFLLTA